MRNRYGTVWLSEDHSNKLLLIQRDPNQTNSEVISVYWSQVSQITHQLSWHRAGCCKIVPFVCVQLWNAVGEDVYLVMKVQRACECYGGSGCGEHQLVIGRTEAQTKRSMELKPPCISKCSPSGDDESTVDAMGPLFFYGKDIWIWRLGSCHIRPEHFNSLPAGIRLLIPINLWMFTVSPTVASFQLWNSWGSALRNTSSVFFRRLCLSRWRSTGHGVKWPATTSLRRVIRAGPQILPLYNGDNDICPPYPLSPSVEW